MAPQQFALAAPTTEELTSLGAGLAGAGIAGVVEGVVVKLAPQLGALETPFTWATLLGVPAIGVAGALFAKGMIGDLFKGIAAGGTAIAAYVVPAMVMPAGLFGKKGNLTADQRAALAAGRGIKRLGAGNPFNAPQTAQDMAARSAGIGLTLE